MLRAQEVVNEVLALEILVRLVFYGYIVTDTE
jgi:hypothetical protein